MGVALDTTSTSISPPAVRSMQRTTVGRLAVYQIVRLVCSEALIRPLIKGLAVSGDSCSKFMAKINTTQTCSKMIMTKQKGRVKLWWVMPHIFSCQ